MRGEHRWRVGGATLLAVLAAGAAPAAACDVRKVARAHKDPSRLVRAPLIVGDSTMLLATPYLGARGVEADARGCRQLDKGIDLLAARRRAGTLPRVAVLALGSNGAIGAAPIRRALRVIGRDRALGLVTPARVGSGSVAAMRRAARRYPDRVVLIDWMRYSRGRGGVFAGDGLHVSDRGARLFAGFVRRRLEPFFAPRAARAPDRPRCDVLRSRAPRRRVRHPWRRPRELRPRASPDPRAAIGGHPRLALLRLAPRRAAAVERRLRARGPQGDGGDAAELTWVLRARPLQGVAVGLTYNRMVVDAVTDEEVDRLFHALADGTRRDILHRCVRAEPSVSRLADVYPMSFAAVQKHVAVLEQAGLVTKERRGREQLVRSDHGAVGRARRVLDELETAWRGRVDRMADLLEQVPQPDGGKASTGDGA